MPSFFLIKIDDYTNGTLWYDDNNITNEIKIVEARLNKMYI